MTRDPRYDPQPGDILQSGPGFYQKVTVTVRTRNHVQAVWWSPGARYLETTTSYALVVWRYLMANACPWRY